MYKIKYDNKNQYQGNETWYDKNTFNTLEEVDEYLRFRNYKKIDSGTYEEVDFCPTIAYVELSLEV